MLHPWPDGLRQLIIGLRLLLQTFAWSLTCFRWMFTAYRLGGRHWSWLVPALKILYLVSFTVVDFAQYSWHISRFPVVEWTDWTLHLSKANYLGVPHASSQCSISTYCLSHGNLMLCRNQKGRALQCFATGPKVMAMVVKLIRRWCFPVPVANKTSPGIAGECTVAMTATSVSGDQITTIVFWSTLAQSLACRIR